MSYKPDEEILMAYLYGELSESEREKVEDYLKESPEGRLELQKMQEVRNKLAVVKDKEVIAPPIFVGDRPNNRHFWSSGYFKSIMAVAASLLVLIVAARLVDLDIAYSDKELRIGFGKPETVAAEPVELINPPPSITPSEVQAMINASLQQNNEVVDNLQKTQEKLSISIRQNLASNADRMNELVRTASAASQEQISSYVAALQAQNMQMVKDYFQMTSSDQKQYIEDLLVDFAQYLQQQRNDDLMLLQTRLNDIEHNTDQFKLETEQILSSIITNPNLHDNTVKH